MFSLPRALVTGGAGFIGSHLTEGLLRNGWEVTVLDNLATGSLANLARVQSEIQFFEGDIRDGDLVRAACEGVDVVFHQAALGSVPRSIQDPLTTHLVNVDGTLNVLIAARHAGVRRVVYAASSSAYGNTPTLPKVESMPAKPLSPYAVSKYVGELYLSVFERVYGLETCGLRYFNVFGPRQNPNSQYAAVIPKFITALLSGEAPTIHGDGETSRDFTFIDNVVHANLLAASAPKASGAVVNIACGSQITLNQLVGAMNELLGTQIDPVHGPERAGDVKHSLADLTLAEELLGYIPVTSFTDGLRQTVGWYREQVEGS